MIHQTKSESAKPELNTTWLKFSVEVIAPRTVSVIVIGTAMPFPD
jgi:hypothetical protein